MVWGADRREDASPELGDRPGRAGGGVRRVFLVKFESVLLLLALCGDSGSCLYLSESQWLEVVGLPGRVVEK